MENNLDSNLKQLTSYLSLEYFSTGPHSRNRPAAGPGPAHPLQGPGAGDHPGRPAARRYRLDPADPGPHLRAGDGAPLLRRGGRRRSGRHRRRAEAAVDKGDLAKAVTELDASKVATDFKRKYCKQPIGKQALILAPFLAYCVTGKVNRDGKASVLEVCNVTVNVPS